MAYFQGVAEDYLDLNDLIIKSACGYGTYSQVSKTMGGTASYGYDNARAVFTDERVATFPATVTETWTITCTDDTIDGSEVWSVNGVSSGVQAVATTGVPYTNGFIGFTITDSTVSGDIVVGNSFVIDTVQGLMKTEGFEWVIDYDGGYPAYGTTDDDVVILKGQGTSGTDEIYVGLRPYASVGSDYYNLLVTGMTGYVFDGTLSFINSCSYTNMPCWNTSTPYWITVNSRRVIVSAKVNNNYVNMYFGFMLPYATPSEYPYPLVIAANSRTTTRQYADTDVDYGSIAQPRSDVTATAESNDSAKVLAPGGAWSGCANYYGTFGAAYTKTATVALFPTDGWSYAKRDGAQVTGNEDGTRNLEPLVFHSDTYGVLGEYDGVYWISGHGYPSAVQAEDTILVSGQNHTIFQNIHRQEWEDYFCMETT